MPWCDTCDRFYNPNSLRPDGACPTCGRLVGAAGGESASDAAPDAVEDDHGAPWHFKLLIGVTGVYLGYRLIQGIEWVAHHI